MSVVDEFKANWELIKDDVAAAEAAGVPYDPMSSHQDSSSYLASHSSGNGAYNITSLDQIINPYDYAKAYLSDQSTAGKALYLHKLEEGKFIQSQQMAAYENWYNSPEQQALRQREAGLNPDLVGVENTASASAAAPEGSGVSSLPTSEQITAQKFQNIIGLVQGVASVAGLVTNFAQIPNLKKQGQVLDNQATQGQLQNIATQEALFGHGISSRLADAIGAVAAGSEFDSDAWFADETNLAGIYEAFSSSDSPQNKAIFQNVLRNKQSLLSKANEIAAQKLSNQTDFATLASDPLVDDSVVLQTAQLTPVMSAIRELEDLQRGFQKQVFDIKKRYMDSLSPEQLAEFQNKLAIRGISESEYYSDYFEGLDGEIMASYEAMIKSAENVKATMQKAIQDNLFSIYSKNPNNIRGFAAAYLYSGGAAQNWYEFLGSYEILYSKPAPINPQNPYLPNTGSALHDWMKNPLGVADGLDPSAPWRPPGSVAIPW